jgi:hypothetical protein
VGIGRGGRQIARLFPTPLERRSLAAEARRRRLCAGTFCWSKNPSLLSFPTIAGRGRSAENYPNMGREEFPKKVQIFDFLRL